ncbi:MULTISPECIES: hypothetical protein [unclassified Pseudomonas]|uniref:hypothetical protein n=1 Tax=unclassified Pseudomonas TaxID=196821 RepID=UPI000C88A3F9|nr:MULTISPECIES: hypothetical protein [unclassified Pseudomonas]PMX22720.1 hypothetical protein C1Y23_19125 [Pseudomonas sp. GW460-12]PMX31753.1 hypothetical protein C1Y24_23445 [Pseudomonas sp. MPR-R2A4]PMX39046.1 hypothetical protein C1Y26_20350 [Pseudomonas sp. MPR-R2A7]PMX51746.1 hypothetical protein C1Y17_22210 [Pseudomonas sp. MPR-R2A6]PMX87136.1 hypothetical protein C1Y21_23600 [Pseudomonas sp. MPR-R2A3]
MSKPIQTVEELDAVPHWRRKHALAIKERDALKVKLTAADERWDELVSAVRSINYGPAHKISVPGDDEPQYRQRKEWIEWVLGLCDTPLKPVEGGGSACNQIREESGLPINTPCQACGRGACIDR